MFCCILYVVASYVILLLRKALKEFKKMFRFSFFYNPLVILKSLQNKTNSLLTSEQPFSTPGDKFKFVFLTNRAVSSAADCTHRPLTELHLIAGNTAHFNFWIEATCVLKYTFEMMWCTFVVRTI